MTPFTYHCFRKPDPDNFWTFILIIIIALMTIFVLGKRMGWCEEYTNEQIADAIYIIEGGSKAQFAYGIRSVKYSTLAKARRICLNTIRNNRIRYAKYGYKQYPDYLSFLQSRYCPTKGKLSIAEKKLNGNWLRNLRKQLARSPNVH